MSATTRPEPADRPPWADRIRAERLARGWTQRDAIRALRLHADRVLPDDAHLLRMWKNWETGRHFPRTYQREIAALFGTVSAALFEGASHPAAIILTPTPEDTMELAEHLRHSDVSPSTLDGLATTVERLCTEYSFRESGALRMEAVSWLARLDRLLDARTTLEQHRHVLVLAGWLSLLVGCLDYDLNRPGEAESSRRIALQLGQESGHATITAWAHELRAWFALTQARYREVIEAARQGRVTAPRSPVAVQLAAQEAKAWARVGDRRQVEHALERGRQLLESLPYPDNVRNHFTVDPDKFDFYAMDCYRRLDEGALADVYAGEVMRKSIGPGGTVQAPMRVAEARITQAVLAARRGDLDGALSIGSAALDIPRRSAPSLLMVGTDLAQELRRRYPHEPRTEAYVERLRSLAGAG